MKTILLTGGRAPVTLELARLFHASGNRVVVAESFNLHLCRASRSVTKNYHIPSPRHDFNRFIAALVTIIQQEQVDLLIPTCEEIFYIARGLDSLTQHCAVLAQPLDCLRPLHSKWEFVQRAQQYGLNVPATTLLTHPGQLAVLQPPFVLKPVFSRFATRTLLASDRGSYPSIVPTLQSPWVAQQYLEGRQLCTYSLAHQGRITAHTCYPADFTAGRGAAIHFRHIEHQTTFQWVKTFVEAERFSGQIAFDFIETVSGELFALECNPRATSGVHLLATNPGFANAFWNDTGSLVEPLSQATSMLTTAMLFYGLPTAISTGTLTRWAKAFAATPDIIFTPADPLPGLWQFVSLSAMLGRAIRNRVSALEASTLDIEWNGEL